MIPTLEEMNKAIIALRKQFQAEPERSDEIHRKLTWWEDGRRIFYGES